MSSQQPTPTPLPEPVEVTLLVTGILESLEIPYAIVGSMAGTIYGRVRTTMDVDLVVDLHPEQVEPLVLRLDELFYADIPTITTAVQRRSHFNLIHLETMFKVDIFLPKDRPYDQQILARRVEREISSSGDFTYFVTAEDLILAKLEWYRFSGGTSGRQWKDVVAIIHNWATDLDKAYLRRWAENLEILDLLNKAQSESRQ